MAHEVLGAREGSLLITSSMLPGTLHRLPERAENGPLAAAVNNKTGNAQIFFIKDLIITNLVVFLLQGVEDYK